MHVVVSVGYLRKGEEVKASSEYYGVMLFRAGRQGEREGTKGQRLRGSSTDEVCEYYSTDRFLGQILQTRVRVEERGDSKKVNLGQDLSTSLSKNDNMENITVADP
ncbi:hypothetical protein CONPUDRAFT_77722 [Coniophora puteana RWD-64-598 SS2]|uniref:Uncharacterized protein n=1 Tax=Coniophora puteana (strain RWD-64-598) TaxID=741705 RepID=A0A5M3M6H0_CONPW|nr:uncharacterized protein CONPUDRAFT_77722 [Coniophora puteana RWD-64-598 SS2]EIW74929.1 hypothetical protein CONPUDRAFT_77722 [Coniophora puteana RWD-64-598 SS2]